MALRADRFEQLSKRLIDLGADARDVEELIDHMRKLHQTGDPMSRLELRQRIAMLGVDLVELWLLARQG